MTSKSEPLLTNTHSAFGRSWERLDDDDTFPSMRKGSNSNNDNNNGIKIGILAAIAPILILLCGYLLNHEFERIEKGLESVQGSVSVLNEKLIHLEDLVKVKDKDK